MTLDTMKAVNFHPGMEVRAQDFDDSQNFLLARLLDGMFEKLVPGPIIGDLTKGTNLLAPGAHGNNVPNSSFAFALTSGGAYPRKGTANTKIQIAPGTLFQKVAARDGNEQKFLPFVFDGTLEVTIANGDAANPRVDIVQMKLEMIDDDSQARVFAQDGIKASRDLNPLTSNCETVIRARAAGFGGNAISIQFVADGAGAGSLTQSGYALVFHYQSGVTTVANFETAVQASALIEVQTTDGVGTLTSPGDTFGPVFLTGGTDQVLTSQSFNVKRRVQATISVKQGTPAASPTYPTPDAGYVVIAGVVVPATWVGASAPVTIDSAAAGSLVIHDQRMPIGTPTTVTLYPRDFMAQNDGSNWSLDARGRAVTGVSGAADLYAVLPVGHGGGIGGGYGRVVALQVACSQTGGVLTNTHLARMTTDVTPTYTLTNLNKTDVVNIGAGNLVEDDFDEVHTPAAGPTILPNAAGVGVPVWSNGRRALEVADTSSDQFATWEKLVWKCPAPPAVQNLTIWQVTFFIAEGL